MTNTRYLLLAAVLSLTVCFAGTAAGDDASLGQMDGNGTEQNPYVITDAHELQAIQEDSGAHYVLGNDIDATGTVDWNGGNGFDPIGTFNGELDGQGHTITGLTVDRAQKFCGFAERVKGEIRNATFESVSIRCLERAGGIAWTFKGATVEQVSVSGAVEGKYAAGITTSTYGGTTIDRVVTDVDVTATRWAAGAVVNLNGRSDLTRVYVSGELDGNGDSGGVVQRIFTKGYERTNTVRNVRSNVTGVNTPIVEVLNRNTAVIDVLVTVPDAGVNRNRGDQNTVYRDIYLSSDISGDSDGLPTDQMTGPEARQNLDGLDFRNVWTATDGFPVLQWRVEDVSLSLADDRIAVGDSTDVTVELDLFGGDTVTASTTADFDSNTSAASVEDGALVSADRGTAAVTATVAGYSDTATVEMVAPPDIGLAEATLDTELVAQGSPVTVEATAENVGDLEGTETLSLQAGGETVAESTVTVAGRSEASLTFEWTPSETGTYELTVDGESVGTLEVAPPPEIETASASVSEDVLLAGATTNVTVTLENPDQLQGTETAAFAVEGTTRDGRTLTVDGGQTETAAFAWTPSEAGTYNLTGNGVDAGTVTVVPRAAVSVTNVTAPADARTGDTAAVTAAVTNEANRTVPVAVTYALGGDDTATETVAADPGGTTVTFEPTLSTAGTVAHAVSAAGSEATAETAVSEPATFEITNRVGPDSVTPGEAVTVTATVENSGGVAGEETVAFLVDGATATEKTVSLDAGESTRVSASFTLQAQGEHEYAVETSDDSVSASITAESESGSGGTTAGTGDDRTTAGNEGDGNSDDRSDGSSDDTSDGSGPGFGVVPALLAVVAFAALARDR